MAGRNQRDENSRARPHVQHDLARRQAGCGNDFRETSHHLQRLRRVEYIHQLIEKAALSVSDLQDLLWRHGLGHAPGSVSGVFRHDGGFFCPAHAVCFSWGWEALTLPASLQR
jgi:hypothetical protein